MKYSIRGFLLELLGLITNLMEFWIKILSFFFLNYKNSLYLKLLSDQSSMFRSRR